MGIEIPKFDKLNSISIRIWEKVSEKYAILASAEVYVILGERVRKESIRNTMELPALKANKKITKIIAIDPKTKKEVVIFYQTKF